MRKWLRRAVGTIAALVLIVLLVWLIYVPSTTTRDRETYAALSDYLTNGLTGESHDLGSANGLVVIYGRTSTGFMRILVPPRAPLGSHGMRLEAMVINIFSQALARRFSLRAPYKFTIDSTIEMKDLSEVEKRTSYGVITFSKVSFNHEATQALFYTEHLCGLCGGGEYVLMQKQAGRWRIIGEAYTWIS